MAASLVVPAPPQGQGTEAVMAGDEGGIEIEHAAQSRLGRLDV